GRDGRHRRVSVEFVHGGGRYASPPVTASPVVSLHEVSVVYNNGAYDSGPDGGGATPALVDVDWEVRPGERWVVIGPNGSGKTTLVQLNTRYLHPTPRDFTLLGARLGHGVDWRRLRLRIGVVSAAFAKMIRPAL